MMFKGINFRRNNNYVTLRPKPGRVTNDGREIGENYCVFGKEVPQDTPGAEETGWVRIDNGKKIPVWAIPVVCTGHSLTNMMYGIANGRAMLFLCYDGQVYTAPTKKQREKDNV